MRSKILVTDKVHDTLIEGLKALDFEVTYTPKMSYDEVRRLTPGFEALVINSKVVCDRAFLAKHQHLDFIARLGSGLDIIDLVAAEELGVPVISSPEGNANAVGEHALGMLLMLLQKMYPAFESMRQGKWIREAHRGTALSGKTVGILGYGHTGPAFAEKLSGLDVNIIAYDKYIKDITDLYVEEVGLVELVRRSDVLSIHLPLTKETDVMIDADFMGKMKAGSIIINTSRGRILDSAALLGHLQSGHLAGACLDVIENEQPATWTSEERSLYLQLFNHPSVIATPHVAGWTHRSLKLIAEVLLKKISNHIKS